MKNSINWAGMLSLGAYLFALMILLDNSQDGGNSGLYAVISIILAVLAVPFSVRAYSKDAPITADVPK